MLWGDSRLGDIYVLPSPSALCPASRLWNPMLMSGSHLPELAVHLEDASESEAGRPCVDAERIIQG
jgi:hypothetical protein